MSSYEELKKQKSAKIKEWLEYLDSNNEDDILWKQKNRVYASSVPDWLYLMAKEKQDDIIDKQYEIAQPIAKYINELNREKVYSIVKQLNDLENGETINEFHFDYDEIISQANKKIAEIKREELEDKTPKEKKQIIEQWDKEEKAINDITNSIINNLKASKANNLIQENDNILVSKKEYEQLKKFKDKTLKIQRCDFALIVNSGNVLPILHPNYNEDRIKIEIYGVNDCDITIDGNRYIIKTQILFNKIKSLVNDKLDLLIDWSIKETNSFLDNNVYYEDQRRNIIIKYGQILININGQVSEKIGKYVEEFINNIKQLVIDESDLNDKDYIISNLNSDNLVRTQENSLNDNDKIVNLLVNKIENLENGKQFSIMELINLNGISSSKDINLTKISVDTLRKAQEKGIEIMPTITGVVGHPYGLPYIKVGKKDMENSVLYSETINDLKIDKLDTKLEDENLKTIIDEVISNNQEMIGSDIQYCNTILYDIVKKIIDLPYDNVTTIADLINYNPNEKYVEPIMQGKIRILVDKICKKLNIEIEANKDKIGGLAYYGEFVKLNKDRF